MKDPVGVKVMDAIQDLVQQRLDHSSRQLKRLLVGLGRSVELNNVLQKRRDNNYCGVVCIMIEIHHLMSFVCVYFSILHGHKFTFMLQARLVWRVFHFLDRRT